MFNYKDTFNKNYIDDHPINKLGHFINGFHIDEKSIVLCDELINEYNSHSNKLQFYGNLCVELDDTKLSEKLDEQLFLCMNTYAKTYPASVVSIPGVIEKCILQSSKNGKQWNSIETISVSKEIRSRHLAFILFLNDLPDDDKGYIVFYHQKLVIQPKKGMILLFPDNWQHIYTIEPSKEELYWLSGHISNVTNEEKIEFSPKLKVTAPIEDVNYKFGE
jgi:hypothetical protein